MGQVTIFKFELGCVVEDMVTGFRGVVTGRTEWLNHCVRYQVESRDLHEGKPIEPQWIDEGQLKLVGAVLGEFAAADSRDREQAAGRAGGPTATPQRRRDPSP